MEEDFNFNSTYGCNPLNENWDFSKREREMDEQFDQGLKYKSRVTLNLIKQKAK